MKFEARVGIETRQPPILEAYIVRGVQVVDGNDLVTGGQQLLSHFGPDEAGCAGEEIARHQSATTFGRLPRRVLSAFRLSKINSAASAKAA